MGYVFRAKQLISGYDVEVEIGTRTRINPKMGAVPVPILLVRGTYGDKKLTKIWIF